MIKILAEDQFSYYVKTLSIISALSPSKKQLSDLEIETLARFLSLPKKFDYFPFTALAKKIIYKEYTPPLSIAQLSTRVISLINKGYLVRDEDNFVDFSPHIKRLRRTNNFNAEIQIIPTNTEDSQGS